MMHSKEYMLNEFTGMLSPNRELDLMEVHK